MTKHISAGAELLGRNKAKNDPNFDLNSYLAKAEGKAAKRHSIVESFVNELNEETLVGDYMLRTLAHHLFYGTLCAAEEAETVAKQFVKDAKQKTSTYPAVIVTEWINSKYASVQMAEVLAKEVARLAQEDGLQLTEIDIHSPPTEEAGHYFQAAFNSEAVDQLRAEYIAILDLVEKYFREWLEFNKNGASTSAVPPLLTAPDYTIHVSQEIDAIMRACCDGKTFVHYLLNDQARTIVYERPELPHSIRLSLTADEADAGLSLAHLEKLIRAQDADGALTQQYIMRVLAPPSPLPPRAYAGGWIDFDDVIKQIGWEPQTTKERREMHAKIWEFVRYGERAHIIGKRTIPYKDPITGEEINTEIHGAAWRVLDKEVPISSLYSALDVPVRAEIILSKELTALITDPKTAQYLEMGEALGAIPGGKPSGAWARVVGMALMSFWRRKPRETLTATLKPTRRELLDHYAAKIKPYDEVLRSSNPGRVIEYWCGALGILADQEIIAREGEAKRTAKEVRAALPRQGWRDAWLNETVDIWPGAGRMKASIEGRAKALPASKPRNLNRSTKRRKP